MSRRGNICQHNNKKKCSACFRNQCLWLIQRSQTFCLLALSLKNQNIRTTILNSFWQIRLHNSFSNSKTSISPMSKLFPSYFINYSPMKAKKGRNSWFITLWYLKCKQYIELTVNDKLERCGDMTIAYTNILFQHFHGWTALRKWWNKPLTISVSNKRLGARFTLECSEK
jgi:hypothetical protein